MTRLNKLLLVPYILWLGIFIINPILLLIYFSLTDSAGHWSLSNYHQILSWQYVKMFSTSMIYAFIITFITLLVSYPAAYYVAQSRHQQMLLLILIVPTWINLLLKTYAFIGIFSHDGIINRLLQAVHLPELNILFTGPAFVVVAVYIYIPFMILPIFNSLRDIPHQLIQAASDLGATPWTTFRKIIFPLSLKGVMTGVQVTFIPALSLFMITRLIAGNKVINIGTAIEEQFLVIQNYGLGSAIALVLVIFMVLVLIVTQVTQREGRG